MPLQLLSTLLGATMDEFDADSPAENELNQQNGEYSYNPEDGADEDEDYDPSSFNFGDDSVQASTPASTAVQTESQSVQPMTSLPEPAAPEQPTAPKTVGGFIIDDDDDEDEDEEDAPPAPSQLNGTDGANSGLGAVAVAEAQDVSLASEPTQDTPAVPQNAGLNGSTATAPLTIPTIASASDVVSAPSLPPAASDQGKALSPAQSQAPAPAPLGATESLAATPQPPAQTNGNVPPTPITQRLPHDKVGRLEDRIKEDPKADTQAWWSLLQHYKDKDQIDKVREVYERFLQVFPQAVRI